MQAILIDPYKEELRAVEYNGDYKQIYEHIKADCFTLVRLANDDDVFVDDEGLLKVTPETKFFMLRDYPQPLAGYGLILGNDEEGESVDVHHTVEFYRPQVQFLDAQMVGVFGYFDS